jgi:hypothetical protein
VTAAQDWISRVKSTVSIPMMLDRLNIRHHKNRLLCPLCRKTDGRRLLATYGSHGWRCWHGDCGIGGDAIDLVSVFLTGRTLGTDSHGKRTVHDWLSGAGLLADGDAVRHLRALPAPAPVSDNWPDRGEVMDLWSASRPITEDLAVQRWIAARYGDHAERLIALIAHLDLARAIPLAGPHPGWARFGGRRWIEASYRMVFPLCDHTGEIRSLRARRVGAAEGGRLPKAVPAQGVGCRGLVLGCDRARALLAGAPMPASWPAGRLVRAVVVEGETDWMSWLSRRTSITDPALIGVYSGAWSQHHAEALPHGTILAVRTDDNPAGHRYAEGIAESCRGRRDLSVIRGGVA